MKFLRYIAFVLVLLFPLRALAQTTAQEQHTPYPPADDRFTVGVNTFSSFRGAFPSLAMSGLHFDYNWNQLRFGIEAATNKFFKDKFNNAMLGLYIMRIAPIRDAGIEVVMNLGLGYFSRSTDEGKGSAYSSADFALRYDFIPNFFIQCGVRFMTFPTKAERDHLFGLHMKLGVHF